MLQTKRYDNETPMFRDVNGHPIQNILQRPEFMSREMQIYRLTNFETKPLRSNQNDIFYEDNTINQEHTKAIQMRRRDMFFHTYHSTRGDFAVFDLLHNRGSHRSLCKSYPPARFNTLICNNPVCFETGPCLHYGSQPHLHNCNRLDSLF